MKYTLPRIEIRTVGEPLCSDKRLDSPYDAALMLSRWLSDADREQVLVVNLQSDLRPINFNVTSTGTLNSSQMHPREILKSAVLSNARYVMLIHNHPSGKLDPSETDIKVTEDLSKACSMMQIPLIDHVITGPVDGIYYSFRDHGLIKGVL